MANPAMDTKSSMTNSGSSLATTGANMGKELEQNIHKFSRETGEKAGEIASLVKDSTAEYYKAGRDYVKANPVRGAAYAAATGLVVGSLLTLIFRGRSN